MEQDHKEKNNKEMKFEMSVKVDLIFGTKAKYLSRDRQSR